MDTTSITPTIAGSTTQSASQTGSKRLAESYDTFLQLLTTQLQYQDPTSPLDTNQFTQQLVSFTNVEQSIQTNKNLESLISLVQSQNLASVASSYLGNTVTADSDQAWVEGNGATWNYRLDASSAETKLVIRNSRNQIVRELSGAVTAGSHQITWDGRDNNGLAVPSGTYQLSVQATTAADTTIGSHVSISGRVSSIEQNNGSTQLLVNGLPVGLDKISRIDLPAQTVTLN